MHAFADPIEMQSRLFAELSRMFGNEVPLYGTSLTVNDACNRAVCDLLAAMHAGFAISDVQLFAASGERHGAIRIGRPDEYRWIARFFACFGMRPHNFYDMTSVGAKSQPVIATAFRSTLNPQHRVFASLLQTDYFDDQTRAKIESLLAARQVFSDTAKQLIERAEAQGGLDWCEADLLIAEATGRIFRWTGEARDHELYTHLCDAGFKIAADIACFPAHHLNHLTPNTLCIDLYTSVMKLLLGETDRPACAAHARRALERVQSAGDRDFLRLCFAHLTRDEILSFEPRTPAEGTIERLVDTLLDQLETPAFDLSHLRHNGFKDHTEGPAADTPVLLRQDAYKALTEPVRFTNADGRTIDSSHTARFGEIEQRFYATTLAGRALYDECLARAEAETNQCRPVDADTYEAMMASCFAPFPKTLGELLDRGLVYGRYEPTDAGLAAAGSIETADPAELVRLGYAAAEGLRYEDFLPVSAAGIFASNLNQYGTASTSGASRTYTQAMLESVLGCEIVNADAINRALHADSLLATCDALRVTDRLAPAEHERLMTDAERCPEGARRWTGERPRVAASLG